MENTNNYSHELTAWLCSIQGIESVEPLRLRIKGTTYQAARYLDARRADEANSARERIYVLGPLPACYRRSTRTCFRFAGDNRDWYIAAYMTQERLDAFRAERPADAAHYHPCGEHFLMTAWEVPDGQSIDHYESKRRTRVEVGTLEIL